MGDFEITITGSRNDDGGGDIKWRHTANDGKQYGDFIQIDSFDEEWRDAVEQLAIQATKTLQMIYCCAKGQTED